MNSNPEQEKKQLRKLLREQRQSVFPADRSALDRSINQHLLNLIEEKSLQTIAAFWPNNGEPDMRPSLNHLFEQGKTCALPVVGKPGQMGFHRWQPGVPMESNRYGIPEPVNGAEIQIRDIDLISLPLVAFNRHGLRLGMGGGYYDRALQEIAQQPNPLRVGIAYGLQEHSEIPAEDWDISLHGVITETGWFTCHS